MTQELLVTSQDTVEGYKITQTHGLVMGNTVRARHIGADFMAGLRNIVGGESASYTKLITEAREEALERLKDEARKSGGNALVTVRFSTSAVIAGMMEILAYGTAVTIEEKKS